VRASEASKRARKCREGGIVKHKGSTLAVYRHESGAWSACSATCTHLGCDLLFNAAEKTFDCPVREGKGWGEGGGKMMARSATLSCAFAVPRLPICARRLCHPWPCRQATVQSGAGVVN